jgi:hypothetical protein
MDQLASSRPRSLPPLRLGRNLKSCAFGDRHQKTLLIEAANADRSLADKHLSG